MEVSNDGISGVSGGLRYILERVNDRKVVIYRIKRGESEQGGREKVGIDRARIIV